MMSTGQTLCRPARATMQLLSRQTFQFFALTTVAARKAVYRAFYTEVVADGTTCA
jgi:hypothetical protein